MMETKINGTEASNATDGMMNKANKRYICE